MSCVIVLQARMTSDRLPGKVLSPLDGQPLVVHCVRRLVAADAGIVVLAAPRGTAHDELCGIGARAGATVARGSEADVLERVCQAARRHQASRVIRATADNPAVDPDSVHRVLGALDAGADYAVDEGLPLGGTVEGVAWPALETAAREASDPYEREHVTPFIRRRPDRFAVRGLAAPPFLRRPDLRFTVDTVEDARYMDALLGRAGAARRIVPLAELIDMADAMSVGTMGAEPTSDAA